MFLNPIHPSDPLEILLESLNFFNIDNVLGLAYLYIMQSTEVVSNESASWQMRILN